jgi:hypothetical protein
MKPSIRSLFLVVFSLLLVSSAFGVYDPRLGRWLSRDPIGEEGGFNLYAYCGNDPVNRWDYLGMAERNGQLRQSDLYAKWIKEDWNNGHYLKSFGDFFGAIRTGFTGSFAQAATETKENLPIAAAQMDAAMTQLSNEHPVAAIPIRGINWFAQGPLHLNPLILGSDLSLVADHGVGNTFKAWGGKINSDARRIFTEGSWDAVYDTIENAADVTMLWKGGKSLATVAGNGVRRLGPSAGRILRPSAGFTPTAGVLWGEPDWLGMGTSRGWDTPYVLATAGDGEIWESLFGDVPPIGMTIREFAPGAMAHPETLHHLATIGDARYVPRFKFLFASAGLDLEHPLNKILLPDHVGGHGRYNQIVLDRLTNAVRGTEPGTSAFRANLIGELFKLRAEIMDPSSDLRGLLRSQASKFEQIHSPPP